jgi:hypothetical protein
VNMARFSMLSWVVLLPGVAGVAAADHAGMPIFASAAAPAHAAETPAPAEVAAAHAAVMEAQSSLAARQWSSAIAAADRALAVWPQQGDLFILRGIARYHQGQGADAPVALAALTDLEAGLARGTRYRARALLYAGLAAIAAHQPARATAALETLLTEFPNSSEAARLRVLVPSTVVDSPDDEPEASSAPVLSWRDWWSGYLAISGLHDDDPAQSAATGNRPAAADTGLASWAQLDVKPPQGWLGLRLQGTWTDYRETSSYDGATLGAALTGNATPWHRGEVTALLGVQREWSGHQRFGDSAWGEVTARHRLTSGTDLEAHAQGRHTVFADAARGRAGSEGEAHLRLSDRSAAWWWERARLTTGVNREVDRLGLGSWSAFQLRADWRIGRIQQALLEIHGSWEERYAVQDARPAPRLQEAGATLWLPVVEHLAITGFYISQWAGEEFSWSDVDRTLLGLGSTVWW